MDDSKKKVILIKGDSSRWFEQAIFILKDDEPRYIPKNFVAEAEKIINNYMAKKYSPGINLSSAYSKAAKTEPKRKIDAKQNKSKKYDRFLNISIILCCIFIGLILYYFT